MSQVLAVKAAPDASGPARAAQACAQTNDCFAKAFEQARKVSRRDRQKTAESRDAERSKSAARASREDRTRSSDKTAAERSREESADRPGRVDRLQAAAQDARSEKTAAQHADTRPGAGEHAAEAQPTTSEQGSTQNADQPAVQVHEESDQNVPQQQQLGDQALAVQATAPIPVETGLAAGPEPGDAGTDAMPPGTSLGLPGDAVPVPAAADGVEGNPPVSGVSGANAARPQPLLAALQEAAAEPTGVSEAGKGKPAADGEGDGEAKPALGTNFQTAFLQAGRARQSAQSPQLVTSPADTNTDSTQKPVELNSASGPEDLARVLRSSVGSRHSNMMIQLDPPELGRVRVDVRLHDEVMTVRFEAQTQAGHDALQGRLHELIGALEQQGVRLDRVEVQYRPPTDGQQNGQSPPQHSGQPWQEPRSGGEGSQSQARQETSTFTGRPLAEGVSVGASSQVQTAFAAASGLDVVA